MSRILVIEDSAWQRKFITKMLRGGGHDVLEAESGEQGLDVAAKEGPDLITLDLLMPGMDGLKVLEALRERGLTIPVIMVTADVQKTTATRCRDLGARAIFNKPPPEDDFLQTIQNVIAEE